MQGFPAQLRKQISQIKDLYKKEFKSDENPVTAWQIELYDYLDSLKDLFLAASEKAGGELTNVIPFVSNRQEYIPPNVPKREPHFTVGAVYYLPPIYGQVDDFLTNQVLQGIVHVNEIWAAEITGLVLWLWSDMPWEFYLETSRWVL